MEKPTSPIDAAPAETPGCTRTRASPARSAPSWRAHIVANARVRARCAWRDAYHDNHVREFGYLSGILLPDTAAMHLTTATCDLRTSAAPVSSSLDQIRTVEAEFVI